MADSVESRSYNDEEAVLSFATMVVLPNHMRGTPDQRWTHLKVNHTKEKAHRCHRGKRRLVITVSDALSVMQRQSVTEGNNTHGDRDRTDCDPRGNGRSMAMSGFPQLGPIHGYF